MKTSDAEWCLVWAETIERARTMPNLRMRAKSYRCPGLCALIQETRLAGMMPRAQYRRFAWALRELRPAWSWRYEPFYWKPYLWRPRVRFLRMLAELASEGQYADGRGNFLTNQPGVSV